MKSRRWQWAGLLIPLLLLVSAIAALPAAAQTAPQFPYQWTPSTGHTDGFYYDPITTPGVLVLKVSVTATASFWPPDQTLFVANKTQYSTIDPPYYTMYTLTAPHPVLGGAAGDTVWVLPADYTEFSPGFDRDPAVTTLNGWSNMTLIVDALEQPAGSTFAMWSGSGIVRFTSNNAFPQTWNQGAPAHTHVNWGFTKTGKYVLTARGQLTQTVNGVATTLTSVPYHYTFCVIDETGASPNTILRECGINQGVATTPTPTPTATSTNTPVPSATATNTPVATATPTNTPLPTATPTNTPVARTATPTNTPVLPGATPTPTVNPVGRPRFVWTPPPGIDAFSLHVHPNGRVLDLFSNSPIFGQHAPEEFLFVANNTQFSTTDYPYRTMYTLMAPHPVLGGQPGDTVWVLPVDFTDYAPGFGADVPSPVSNWSNTTLILESMAAPSSTAQFAIWSGSGLVRFSTTGDTTTPQTWNMGPPADWHMNWGFTEQGLYKFSLRSKITGPHGTLTSKAHTYQFCVIPEEGASSDTLMSVCGL